MPDHRSARPVTIRPATYGDADALERVAALDSTRVPTGLMLVAEVDGEIRAGLAPSTDVVVADPFYPTAHLVTLLRVRAGTAPAATGRAAGTSRILGGVRHALVAGR